MMKAMLILATFFSLSVAQADYFSCELRSDNGTLRAFDEAEYRGREATASDEEFICQGRINSHGMTEVRVRSLIHGDSRSSSVLGSSNEVELTAMGINDNQSQTVICKCGMN